MTRWPIVYSAPSPIWPSSAVLATESKSGNLSITRATRALKFIAELGLITYQTEYDPQIGCNIPTDITFTAGTVLRARRL
ncbi:replication protein [Salmonella enterica subsp. arizonae]|uniref:Replication initiation protein n=1 Tax=Salmonella enterica subsp. arizonae TaxID=59203 RepID=A0A379SM79_SALER|nr:replication protein [Salmonella enterica subsp. arizonae]